MKCGFQVFVFVSLGAALAISLPEHNCTEFFTYGVEDGKTFVGIFTAPKAGLQSISWHIKLTWLGMEDSPVHTIDHYPSEEQAVQNINNGLWAQLVVRFRNTSLEMPKLTLLEVNNMTLCSNPKSPLPSNTITINRGIVATREITTIKAERIKMHPVLPKIKPTFFIN
ncbi:hypothetical protein M5D96_000107 [Drosophila gunungcola]|uniref:Serine protease gd N-terminal domain-containing protein n=1 Tax=Drosophila gunungcola TaxID=103775 RepID=A0A9P9YVK3_9MUSC|nr:hypothetical protein M5D96_000107 [Drosophila gunungcola]